MKRIACMSGFQLKILALVFMTIDHLGVVIYPGYYWMRAVGRLAMPIFAFFLVEGMVHTSDRIKYMVRLGAFALISEVAFDLAFHECFLEFSSQNIFFTLLLGALGIYLWENKEGNLWKVGSVYLVSALGELLNTDYGAVGVWLILGFYFTRHSKWKMFLVLAVLNLFFMGTIQRYALLAMPLILLYNEKRGVGLKYLFYAYYPLHLLVIYLIARYIM